MLHPVDDIFVALPDRDGFLRPRVGAGARLAQAEGGEAPFFNQFAEEFFLLRVAAADIDGGEGEVVGVNADADAGAGGAEFFRDQRRVEGAVADPAEFLGNETVDELALVGLLDHRHGEFPG